MVSNDHFKCHTCNYEWRTKKDVGEPAFCPKCKSHSIVNEDEKYRKEVEEDEKKERIREEKKRREEEKIWMKKWAEEERERKRREKYRQELKKYWIKEFKEFTQSPFSYLFLLLKIIYGIKLPGRNKVNGLVIFFGIFKLFFSIIMTFLILGMLFTLDFGAILFIIVFILPFIILFYLSQKRFSE